jgi:hypothetical protein
VQTRVAGAFSTGAVGRVGVKEGGRHYGSGSGCGWVAVGIVYCWDGFSRAGGVDDVVVPVHVVQI